MPIIRVLTPRVTREQALRKFSGGIFVEYCREATHGPLRSIADFYIPFQLFQVDISNRGRLERRILGVDAVGGALSPYSFVSVPAGADLVSMDTKNCVPSCIEDCAAKDTVISKVQRMLFTTGFFRVKNLEISAREIPGAIHVPYWVGIRDSGRGVSFSVMDAVRRRLEGGKVKHILDRWIQSR